MYCWVNTWSSSGDGCMSFFCFVTRGVLQGCPLSGLIFTWVIEPILRAMEALLEASGRAKIRGCADDIGAVLFYSRSRIRILWEVFDLIEQGGGLKLKPRKCVAVPLWCRLSPHAVEIVRNFIRSIAPLWGDFLVQAKAKYLGYWLGPARSASVNWAGPISK